jgi:hypothetical protein
MKGIGVHTTAQALRVAELARSGGAVRIVRLQTLAPAAAPGGAGNNGARRPSVPCYASLSPVEVLTRVWTLPVVAPAKLRPMVGHRLEADLPIPLEQLEWGCRAAQGTSGHEAGVLAQAVRRDRLSRQIDALHAADLLPTTITTEAEGIAALATDALALSTAAGPVPLILAGRREWTLALLHGGLVQAARRTTVEPETTDAVIRELWQVIQAETAGSGISELVWIGDPQAEGPLSSLASMLGVPLVTGVADLRQESGEPIAPEDLADYAVAIGLALAALHQREDVIRLGGLALETAGGPQNRIEKLLARPKRLAAWGVGLAAAALVIQVFATRSETGRMTGAVAAAQTTPAPGLDDKVRAMQRLERYRIDIESIMKEVARVLPDSTNITSVQLSRDRKLVLKGTSKDPKAASVLADALRNKSPRFTSVKPERAAPGQGGEFSIAAEVVGIQKLTPATAKGAAWK